MKWFFLKSIVVFYLITLPAQAEEPTGSATPVIPTPGMVTMVDMGANNCIPCKMMAPIIEELKKEYENQASILYIDVRAQPEVAARFSVRGIPTQIFFGKNGTEAFRHIGFMDKKSIVSTFEKLGATNPSSK